MVPRLDCLTPYDFIPSFFSQAPQIYCRNEDIEVSPKGSSALSDLPKNFVFENKHVAHFCVFVFEGFESALLMKTHFRVLRVTSLVRSDLFRTYLGNSEFSQ